MSLVRAKRSLRVVVIRKAEEITAEAWLKAGLPKGHGLPSARTMAGQTVALQERLLVVLRAQQERYARYIEEHPTALASVHKDAAQDLPPEAISTYHTWLEGVALRREWWREPTLSFERDQAELSAALREALEEAIGTGGVAARRALGALGPGFAGLGQAEAQGLLKEIAAYASSDNLEARAIYQAVADRAAGTATRAAVLRDGAGRLVGAISYRTSAGALDVGHLGALDGAVPGTGVQLLREVAAVAAKEGKDVVLRAPAEAQSLLSGLGFAPDAEGGLRLSARAAITLAKGIPAGAPGWVRVGWLEGPDRARVRALAQEAAAKGGGLVLEAAPGMEAIYQRLGMTRTATGAYVFTAAETAAFASGLTGDAAFAGQISWELAVAGASDWLRDHKIPGVVDEVSKTTHQALVDVLAYGLEHGENTQQLAQRVRQLDNVFGPVRAERIARTEVITANRAGGYQMGKDAGCTEHEWRSRVESPRTRDWHRTAHRQRVPYDQPYTVYNRLGEAQQMMYPGDTSLGAGPDNVIQCRCSERRIKPRVTDDATLGIHEHGLADGPAAPGPVVAGVETVQKDKGWAPGPNAGWRRLDGAMPAPAATRRRPANVTEQPTEQPNFAQDVPRFKTQDEAYQWLAKNVGVRSISDDSLSLEELQELADGCYAGMHGFERRVPAMAIQTSGAGKRAAAWRDDNTLLINRSYIRNQAVRQAQDAENFRLHKESVLGKIKERLDAMMAAGSDPGPEATELAEKYVLMDSCKRWSAGTDAPHAMETIYAHEMGHRLQGKGEAYWAWERALQKNGVSRLDRFAVSEYGAESGADELFAEVHAFVSTGRGAELPDSVRKAYKDWLAATYQKERS